MTYDNQLVAFSDEKHARLLIGHLQQQGVQAIYQLGQGEYSHKVCLLDAEQMEKANRLTKAFLQDPAHPKYQAAAWQRGETSHKLAPMPFSAANLFSSLTHSPFCSLVLVTCILVFVAASLGYSMLIFETLRFQSFSQILANGQWWRVFGPALFHFSVLHIVFNLLWWWTLGSQIERRLGSSSLLFIFVMSALLSNLGQFLHTGSNFGGLSGVVYALLGFVWWIGWLRPKWGIVLPKPVVGFMLIWLLLGYADILGIPMANTAHSVGLLVGCLLAWLFVKYSEAQTST